MIYRVAERLTVARWPLLFFSVNKYSSKTPNSAVDTAPQFLKARAVAQRLNVSTKTIHRWSSAGYFKAHKLTQRVVVFDFAEVLRFVTSARVNGN